MLNFSKFRFFFIFGVCLLSIIFLVPNFYGKSEITAFPAYFPKKQFNLGLDLQGGSHLLLEVDVNTVLREKSNDIVDEVRKILRKKKLNIVIWVLEELVRLLLLKIKLFLKKQKNF